MKLNRKKYLFKKNTKRYRKTYKKRKTNKKKYIKKRRTYKKRNVLKKKRKKNSKKNKKNLVGGVNINDDSNNIRLYDGPLNIKIYAQFANNQSEDITLGMESLFREMGFNDDDEFDDKGNLVDEDDDPPNFLQLEQAFKTGLSKIGNLSRNEIDKLQIKVYASSNNKPKKLVYTTGSPGGDNLLEENTLYYIVPNTDDDKIKAALTDPVHGNFFGLHALSISSQRVRDNNNYDRSLQSLAPVNTGTMMDLNPESTTYGQQVKTVEGAFHNDTAELLAAQQANKRIDDKIRNLDIYLSKPNLNDRNRQLAEAERQKLILSKST